MTAGAEGKARVQFEIDGVRVRRFMPGGHNPQTSGDADRIKLGLGQAHPVLFFQDLDAVGGCGTQASLRGCGGEDHFDVCLGIEQRAHQAVVPYVCSHARLAEYRLLGRGAGVGILDARGQRAEIHQRVGQTRCGFFIGGDFEDLPGHVMAQLISA